MKKYDKIEQRSPEWFQKRKGVISGTRLKNLMGTPKAREEAKYETIAERLTVGVNDGENPMDRGIRLEEDAISMFELEKGVSVERTGFVENDDNQFIGYSPDGIIKDTNDKEDLEIKCPGGKNHVKIWLKNEIPIEYKWQMIQAFIVNPKLEKRYFASFNPDIPVHPLHIIKLTRKEAEEQIEKAKEAQEVFLQEVELILSKIIKL